MARKFVTRLFATAIALSPIPLAATTPPAAAQANVSISFGYFYDELAPYGQWSHHPRWGDVWRPREANFRPYHKGHWDYTDRYGWVWSSAYVWDDIPSHYGRWVYDPSDGWLWIPGYVWAPAWVVWRSGGGYVGWFPMPPDDAFLAGDEVYRTNWDDWDRGYGYLDWYGPSYGPNWLISIGVFVNESHFADRDFSRYVAAPAQVATFVNNTRNVTNYVTVNNYIVNRSVDPAQIAKASGRQIRPVPASDVVKTNVPIEPVNVGRQVQQQERRQHGGDPKASPRARAVALPPSTAHANAGPAPGGTQGGNAQLGNNQGGNQPGGRSNRNAPGANQPAIATENPNAGTAPRQQNQRAQRGNAPERVNQQPNQPPPQQAQQNGNPRTAERTPQRAQNQQAQRGAPPNEAAAPSGPPAVTENRNGRGGGQFNSPPNAGPKAPPAAQANRERQAPPPVAARPQRAPQEAAPPARAEAPPPQPQRQANRERTAPPPEAARPQRAPEAAPPPARAEGPPPQAQGRQANNGRGQDREQKKKE
jgi:hypothetical protein